LTPLSPTFHPLTSQELTNSQVNIKQWETLLDKIHLLEKEIVVNEQQEKLYNEISLIIANIDVLPTEDILVSFSSYISIISSQMKKKHTNSHFVKESILCSASEPTTISRFEKMLCSVTRSFHFSQ
jgi:hypothetical protein